MALDDLPLVEVAHRERVLADLRSLLAGLRILVDEIDSLPNDVAILPLKMMLFRRVNAITDHVQRVFDLHRVH